LLCDGKKEEEIRGSQKFNGAGAGAFQPRANDFGEQGSGGRASVHFNNFIFTITLTFGDQVISFSKFTLLWKAYILDNKFFEIIRDQLLEKISHFSLVMRLVRVRLLLETRCLKPHHMVSWHQTIFETSDFPAT